MKKFSILSGLLMACCVCQAQQPHNEVGYNPETNTLTSLHYGSGNSLESITIAGKTLTTIKVNYNGQPKSISNEYGTLEYTFAGASNVTVTQTVNGETRTDKVPMNSDYVLQFRKDFAAARAALAGVVDKADKFFENGGASLVGNIVGIINDGLENPINVCFQQALEVAKNTENPIIPVNTLEALVNVTKKHESAGEKLKGKAVDYIFNNYKEWRDGWGDFVYDCMKKIDNAQQTENRKKSDARLKLAKVLMDNGATLEDAAKAVEDAYNNGGIGNGSTVANSSSVNNGNAVAKGGAVNNGNAVVKGGGNDGGKGESVTTPDDNEDLPVIDTPDKVAKQIIEMAKAGGRGLPTRVNVSYNRYSVWDPVSYDLVLKPDKKSYETVDYTGKVEHGTGEMLDEPFIFLTIWYAKPDKNNDFSEKKRIYIAKEVDNREMKWQSKLKE